MMSRAPLEGERESVNRTVHPPLNANSQEDFWARNRLSGRQVGRLHSAPRCSALQTSMQCLPAIMKLLSANSMDDSELGTALERADRALLRIERGLARLRESVRDEELRAKVKEVVEELDELIREAAA
jgi:hypothetical protein